MDEQRGFKKLSIHEIEAALGQGLSRATNSEITARLELLNLKNANSVSERLSGENTYEVALTLSVPTDYSEGTEGFNSEVRGDLEDNYGFDK